VEYVDAALYCRVELGYGDLCASHKVAATVESLQKVRRYLFLEGIDGGARND